MNNSLNRTTDEKESKEKEKYPWEAMILMISLVIGGILIALKMIGII